MQRRVNTLLCVPFECKTNTTARKTQFVPGTHPAFYSRSEKLVCSNSIHGAAASATLYSIVETAKANGLKVYDYLELLLPELPKHADDVNRDFIQELLPWSKTVQEKE